MYILPRDLQLFLADSDRWSYEKQVEDRLTRWRKRIAEKPDDPLSIRIKLKLDGEKL